MANSPEECLVVTELLGRERLPAVLGAAEAVRAQERCLHRAEIAAVAHRGEVLESRAGVLCVRFPNATYAALGAAEMLARVAALPPQGGVDLRLRGGIAGADGEAVARALCAASRGGQVLVTAAVRDALGRDDEALTQVEVDGAALAAFALAGDSAEVPAGQPVAAVPLGQVLFLRHGETRVRLEANQPGVVLGRDQSCALTVDDKRASRMHARIVWRDGGFMLIDESTNGTAVDRLGLPEEWLRRSEAPLSGMGRIGCGFTTRDETTARDIVYYELH